MSDPERHRVGITSDFGDMQVVVFMPGTWSQNAYSFRPQATPEELRDVPRRDLAILRAMLQDALDDVDDERRRRIREAPTEAGAVAQPYVPPYVPPRPAK